MKSYGTTKDMFYSKEFCKMYIIGTESVMYVVAELLHL